jgi:hypothetical protein
MRYLLLLILLENHFQTFSQEFVREGVLTVTKTEMYKDKRNSYDTSLHWSYRIWFSDSAVVIENKAIESPPEGKESRGIRYPVYKYTYFDLKTMRGQDYFYLSEKAPVQCNYIAGRGDSFISWKFWKKDPDEIKGYFVLGDTIIQGMKYKLVETRSSYLNNDNKRVLYYLKCNTSEFIFHVDNKIGLEQDLKGCKVYRIDNIYNDVGIKRVFEINLISDTLNEDEKNIFMKWAENAKNTKVPIMQFSEVLEKCTNSPFLIDY